MDSVKLFERIAKFHTYSKYNSSLEKLFNKNTLKYFVDKLHHPHKIKPEDFLDERFKDKKVNTEEEESNKNETDKNKKSLLDYTYNDFLKHKEEIENKKKKIEPWKINSVTPRIPETKITTDPFGYMPNYKSIYKNIPSVIFKKDTKMEKNYKSSTNLKLSFSNNYGHSNEKNKSEIKSRNRTFGKKNYNLKNKKKGSKNQSKFLPLLTCVDDLSPIKAVKTTYTNFDKDNHAFRFSKYSPRKPNILPNQNQNIYINSYSSLPYNKTVDFKKMTKRDERNLYNVNSLKNPCPCYYHPKYDFLEQKSVSDVCFSHKKSKKLIKMNKMQKILTSYQVNPEYSSVDNSKLCTLNEIKYMFHLIK